MDVFHFGTSREPLFGAYEAPAAQRGPAAAVAICQPFGHEYIRAHRVLRNLSCALAAAGLHVLRFDYYGCGDSAGEGADVTVERCQANIAAAIDELKDMAALPRVSVVGVRLGGTLAALESFKRSDVDTLLLWDPVLRGSEYLSDLLELQSAWLNTRPWMHVHRDWREGGEIIGFPLPPALRDGISTIDLTAGGQWRAKRVAVVSSAEADVPGLEAALQRPDVARSVTNVHCDCGWRQPTAVHRTLLAGEIVREICALLTRAQS